MSVFIEGESWEHNKCVLDHQLRRQKERERENKVGRIEDKERER